MELYTHHRFDETGQYIGDKDWQALSWVNVFVDTVSNDPELYGLTELDVFRLNQKRDEFVAAYNANMPDYSNRITVSRKNDARDEAEGLCRTFAMQIKNDGHIPNGAKLEAGIRPRPYSDDSRTPIPEPHTFPVIQVLGMGNGTHQVRYMDVKTQPSGRKPPGVTHLLLFAQIAFAHEMTGDDDDLRLIATPTRNPHQVQFTTKEHGGKLVRYRARWMTAKGLWGPWGASTEPMVVPLSASTAIAIKTDDDKAAMKLAA